MRMKGFEPPSLSAPQPKCGASASFATSAFLNIIHHHGSKSSTFTTTIRNNKNDKASIEEIMRIVLPSELLRNLSIHAAPFDVI